MNRVSPFLVGLVFGIGLCISGMTHPDKVLGFLDLAGAWDPSLAFVMGGAVVIAFAAYRIAAGRKASLSGEPFHLPDTKAIDARLIGGSVIFGVGWGLAGLCPGPAITNLGFFNWRAALFVASMVAGMSLYRLLGALPAPAARVEAALDG
jgi:uncharacterized protein